MKKLLALIGIFFIVIKTYAIDPSGSRLDYGESGVDIPIPLLIIGLVIATIGCFLLGGSKNKDGKNGCARHDLARCYRWHWSIVHI